MQGSSGFYRVGPVMRPSAPEVAEITPRLLIGEYPRVEDIGWLADQHAVTALLSLQDDADLASKALVKSELQRACVAARVRFEHVPVADADMGSLARELTRIVDLVDELVRGGHRVFVHCNAGMNRAPTVAIAYLHARQGLALAAARDHVKQRRRVSVPYMTLLTQLYGPLA